MANSSYSFNYFPLVSGSGGQDSLYSFNSCSKRIHHPHGKFVLFEILHPFGQWVYDYRCFSHCFCFIIRLLYSPTNSCMSSRLMSRGICLHNAMAMAYAASGLFFSNICGMDFLCHRSSRRS